MGFKVKIRTHDFLRAKQTRYPCVTSPMFFKVLLYQNIFIPPRYFGENINAHILSNVIGITEGKKVSPFGTVIVVIAFFPAMSLGKILPGSSSALFRISYDAITFRAMKGEILNVIVTQITKFGFFSEAGLLEVFVSKELIPIDYIYDENFQSGVWFNHKNLKLSIRVGNPLKIRIVGLRNASGIGIKSSIGSIQAIGTMRGFVQTSENYKKIGISLEK